jgi:hypothetical protein
MCYTIQNIYVLCIVCVLIVMVVNIDIGMHNTTFSLFTIHICKVEEQLLPPSPFPSSLYFLCSLCVWKLFVFVSLSSHISIVLSLCCFWNSCLSPSQLLMISSCVWPYILIFPCININILTCAWIFFSCFHLSLPFFTWQSQFIPLHNPFSSVLQKAFTTICLS